MNDIAFIIKTYGNPYIPARVLHMISDPSYKDIERLEQLCSAMGKDYQVIHLSKLDVSHIGYCGNL